ncbi:transglycosylase domain-containing protein [Fontimonas sp. SYSU GA230001]|uniref:transglycosylase domain-containing protein n=1 Tax=Fontimonas sp. SYSU GA230001 TaxID=3142450 RepID=UPI0032B41777
MALAIRDELRSSRLQARYLAGLAADLGYHVEPGPSPAIRFPDDGPYDLRLGYSALPRLLAQLEARDYRIVAQARQSSTMLRLADRGLFLPYHEKSAAGLSLLDRRGTPLYAAWYPLRQYADFGAIPPRLVASLLHIENRGLLDDDRPTRNPAIDWGRLSRAVLDQLLSRFDPERATPGGSTLATQIEKYRHSPGGRTDSPAEKLRQMASASVRAYLDGADTRAARRRIVLDYLNTVPLAARAAFGEVNGIGDGLWAWYGRDFAEINRLLADDAGDLAQRALAYKQALSLLVAQRRPSYYLLQGAAELDALTDAHLRLLAAEGIVPPALRDAALAQKLRFAPPPSEAAPAFVALKAPNALRTQLAAQLRSTSLYDLDRLDLTATGTFDAALQARITDALRQLRTPERARTKGLYGERLLRDGDDPARLVVSFTLFERGTDRNRLLVQTDNVDQPFDLNQGARLDLGSTAKLRTLATYLEIVAELHARHAGQTADALRQAPRHDRDALGAWALDYLAAAQDRSLDAMLDAAMERRYSASPATQFFTGGGQHSFSNFDPADDGRVLTVREAFRRSVNLVFIRLMRDIVAYAMYQPEGAAAQLLEDAGDPLRQDYLARFADREGRQFLARFFRKYRGKSADEALELLLQGVSRTPSRTAMAILSVRPELDFAGFAALMREHLAEQTLGDAALRELYRRYAPERHPLADRGYLAGVHPLELWLVAHLRAHPHAGLAEVTAASHAERQDVYGWLFRTGRRAAQDVRIRTMMETEAFEDILQRWRRLGYPFESLTPSYASAIGASGDRPAALAELIGIIVNDGLRLPSVRIERLRFATGTPYDTELERVPAPAERVLPVAVARALRAALIDVVEEGTARRLKGGFKRDGRPLPVGGKTGTGDHRYEIHSRGGRVVTSRVVSRSATFVFMIDDRWFGSLTAYVPGADAARYSFTSALPVQFLRALADDLLPLLDEAAPSPPEGAR